MASEKTPVIEYLFFKHWNAEARVLSKSVMTRADVREALRECAATMGISLSDMNVSNFLKDVIRGQSASNNWPERLKQLRYTAVQRPGEGNVFEFVPYGPDDTEPFADLYRPTDNTPRFGIQSVSMSLDAKALGRSDEPWLIQTAVNLRVIETHFAVASSIHVVQLSHLQMSVKLRRTEIDALFLAHCLGEGRQFRALVTCEAKQRRERILEHQIVQQVKAAFEITAASRRTRAGRNAVETSLTNDVDLIIPVGMRAVRGVGFYLVEFKPVTRAEAPSLEQLEIAADAVYELKPPVPGI